MQFFKKKPPAEKPVPAQKPRSFFHTDFDRDESDGAEVFAKAMGKAIQRTMKDFRPARAAAGTAMDNSIQEAKYFNSFGSFLPLPQLDYYASQSFIGYQTCAIIAQHWLVDKACTMPARDAARHGYEITVNDGTDVDPKIFDEMRRLDRKYKIRHHCVDFVRKGRIFGIRIAMFVVSSTDPKYYEYPFNPDGVKPGSYKGIVQIDPYWVAPELDQSAASNPMSMDFYQPTYWLINNKRVHKSHLVITRNGDDVPDILKPTYFYGAPSVPQKIAERVYASERTANEAPMLALSKRSIVHKMDLSQGITNFQKLCQKLSSFAEIQNNFGERVISGDEEITQNDTTLTDLDAVIMTQFQLVAAAAEVPATKLMGTSPKGFGASGEYEESSYHEFLESIQEHDLTPLVDRHHLLIMRSIIAPKFKIAPFTTELNWNPTDSPTAKETAEINKTKADTDASLANAGIIDSLDGRQRISNDPSSGYSGIPVIVPGGPGDREHAQEMEEAALAPEENNDQDE